MPQQVSIEFKGGRIGVSDEEGNEVEAERAVVYLVRGNDRPVAGITLADGTVLELPVMDLSFEPAARKATKRR